jgi:E3 ubiquitin-protein ligase HUWE1
VQTAALAALDALARYRGRTSEVLGAVNAGVSHGILMALVRHTVADVAQPASTLPHAFLDALLAFVTYLAQNAAGGSMIVSAGLVPLLIQLIENRLPSRLAVVSKTMQLIDIVLYGFVNAFQLFVAGRGVDALVNRIEVSALWLPCKPTEF